MKIQTIVALFAVIILGISAIFVGLSDRVQSAQQLQAGVAKPLIICDDPAQTGKNFCAAGWAVSACEYACANNAKDKCDWNNNAVFNCKAQCTVANGCTPN